MLCVLPVLLLGAIPAVIPATDPPATRPVPKTDAPRAKTSPASAAMFAQFNLTPLWLNPADGSGAAVDNGFFGHNRQRLEVYFAQMRRDAQNPALYHVAGKDRRWRKVRAFTGTFTLDDLQPALAPAHETLAAGARCFMATGQFALHETAAPRDQQSGDFRGRFVLDLAREPEGRLKNLRFSDNPLTRRSGFVLEGSWHPAAGGATVPILLQKGTTVINSTLMPNFEIGDRGSQINPRYTRVGWATYWENEEWWAGRPVARK